MINYTKPSKIDYRKPTTTTTTPSSPAPFIAPAGYALQRGETINLTTRVVTRSN